MEKIGTRFIILVAGVNKKERLKPALAVADILRKWGIMSMFAFPDGSPFIKTVTEKGYETVNVDKFPEKKGFVGNFLRSLKRKSSLKNSMKTLSTKHIQAVLTLGGITSVPIMDAAVKMNLKIFMLEPNAVMSDCNKEFISCAHRIYLPFAEMIDSVPRSKALVAGVPVEKDVMTAEKRNIPTNKKLLVIFTCRKDSYSINELVRTMFRKYPEMRKEFFILQETGEKDVASIQRFYDEVQVEALCYMQYENRGKYYKTADVVISRPTADVVSELLAMHKPGIFLPLSEHYDVYQKHNAKVVAKKEIGFIVEDGGSMPMRVKKLYTALNSFLVGNAKIKQNIDKLDYEKAAMKVAEDIEKNLSGKV
ncbi:MAG TPA: UDP-N-acetylglucosamine--N-acetylmuramyl-(pentapeptide) pyrophosphoryl-undecaprenol N-acetylglucosamine transferase [bacterium]|nr:UDP-N-acetylglucosamine--N-acetylmuramyl-(pentapeptide) pyrophosphoryl-undecaprenol N-acetylglucosamine transferase [bacterium]